MTNPYAPPRAEVGGAEPRPLPRWTRALRGVAVTGNLLIALTPLAFVFAPRSLLVFAFIYGLLIVLWNGASLLALTTRVAPRLMFWSAIVLNALALAVSAYVFLARGAGDPGFGVVFMVAAILNLVAIDELRRARKETS